MWRVSCFIVELAQVNANIEVNLPKYRINCVLRTGLFTAYERAGHINTCIEQQNNNDFSLN